MCNLVRHSRPLFLVVLVACASRGSVDGTLDGVSFPVSDAVSAAVTIIPGDREAMILMSSGSNLCRDAAIGEQQNGNVHGILIELWDVVANNADGITTAAPVAPGRYTIFWNGTLPASGANLAASLYDEPTCDEFADQNANATAGTVDLTSVRGDRFSGRFDVTLTTGDHLTGTFDPDACPAIQQGLDTPTTIHACP
jgi:hypothetical protein